MIVKFRNADRQKIRSNVISSKTKTTQSTTLAQQKA